MQVKLELFQRQKQMLQSIRAREVDENMGCLSSVFDSFWNYGFSNVKIGLIFRIFMLGAAKSLVHKSNIL